MALLDGKVILVLGTGAGLGKEVVRAMLREGAKLALADLDTDAANAVRDELDPSGERTSVHPYDLSNYEGAGELISDVISRHKHLDGISGVAAYDRSSGGLLDEGILQDWDRTSRINIGGYLAVIREAVEHLKKAEKPAITIVGSIAGAQPSTEWPQLAYSLSKYGQIGLVHNLSVELGPLGIRVNDVAPGYKWGPVLENAYQQVADAQGISLEEALEPAKAKLSLREMPTDANVANTLVFFHSYLSENITGQTVYVDGGQNLN